LNATDTPAADRRACVLAELRRRAGAWRRGESATPAPTNYTHRLATEIPSALCGGVTTHILTVSCGEHDPADACAFPERIAAIENEPIPQAGSRSELCGAPATPFVKGFVR
jgi:hypothetical protein